MQAGMRIGLLADLAVGMSGAGSHAWTSQKDILGRDSKSARRRICIMPMAKIGA